MQTGTDSGMVIPSGGDTLIFSSNIGDVYCFGFKISNFNYFFFSGEWVGGAAEGSLIILRFTSKLDYVWGHFYKQLIFGS